MKRGPLIPFEGVRRRDVSLEKGTASPYWAVEGVRKV